MIRGSGWSWLGRQPPTTATCDLGGQDPKYRVSMVVVTAMGTRNFGSCPHIDRHRFPRRRVRGPQPVDRGRFGRVGYRWARRSRLGPPGRPPRSGPRVSSRRFTACPRLGRVARLGALPSPGVAWTAVPDAGPGRSATSSLGRVPLDRLWCRPPPLSPFLGESGQTRRLTDHGPDRDSSDGTHITIYACSTSRSSTATIRRRPPSVHGRAGVKDPSERGRAAPRKAPCGS
jgi:hypothetical protein